MSRVESAIIELNGEEFLLRTEQWANVKRTKFASDATDEELSVYKEYFFKGDLAKYLGSGGYNDFYSILTWHPSKNLSHLIDITTFYWDWFFQYDDRDALIASYGYTTYEDYINGVIENLSGWTNYLDAKVSAEYFLWVVGEKYEEARVFPLSLNRGQWTPKLCIDKTKVSFNLLRGIASYLKESTLDNNSYKYSFLVNYFSSISHHLYPKLFDLYELNDSNPYSYDSLDQRVVRRLLAHLEGIVTTEDIDLVDGKPMLFHPELVARIKDILVSGPFSEKYKELVDFMAGNGRRCIKVFKE